MQVREDREVGSAVSAPRTSLDERQIPPGVDSRKVYVGNLDYSTSWQDLKDHMRSAGDVIRAEVSSCMRKIIFKLVNRCPLFLSTNVSAGC